MIRPVVSNVVAVAISMLASFSTNAFAASIPADAASQPKVLWRMVMEGYYGPYDMALKCWTARIGADQVCVRPHRLDQVQIKGIDHLFLVIGGSLLDENGQRRDSHADSGVMGLIVLKENGKSLKLVAKNDLHSPFGTFGALPSEDQFAVREIGPNETYGWVATGGWSGQGYTITSSTVFAAIGDTVVDIANIPSHYDDMGNCENGKVMGSVVACTDYSSTVLFDSSDTGNRFFPIIAKVTGNREGTIIDQTFTTTFDSEKLQYRKIDGMPKEFDEGI